MARSVAQTAPVSNPPTRRSEAPVGYPNHGPAKPVLEAGRGDARVAAGGERVVVELCAEVARVDVGRHRARVVIGPENASGQLVEPELFGPSQLDDAVQRFALGDLGQCGSDVIGRLRLDEHRRQANGVAVGARIGDAADELEELRRTKDRVRHRPGLHHLLLRKFRPEIAALRQPVGADHRQRDMMCHACRAASGQAPPPVSLPVGFTTFPGEIWPTPRSWVETSYPNVTYFNKVGKGGHFAAWEEPKLFATEVRAAFESLRSSS